MPSRSTAFPPPAIGAAVGSDGDTDGDSSSSSSSLCSLSDPSAVYLSVIIPVYNEQHRLPAMLDEALAHLAAAPYTSEVLVVDDGSTDGSAGVVAAYTARFAGVVPVVFLSSAGRRRNTGKGATIRRGMSAAAGRLRLMADADGATAFGQVDALAAALAASGAGVAIGSRRSPADAVSRFARWWPRATRAPAGPAPVCAPETAVPSARRCLLRSILSSAFRVAVVLIAGLADVRDTQCGFKLFTADASAVAFGDLHLPRWATDVEVLLRVRAAGKAIAEVPVAWREVPGSKIRLAKAVVFMLLDLLVMRLAYGAGLWAWPDKATRWDDIFNAEAEVDTAASADGATLGVSCGGCCTDDLDVSASGAAGWQRRLESAVEGVVRVLNAPRAEPAVGERRAW
eukprot:TRINITY_DN1125_c0_g1_i1.p1 TRINITY_DN1125_c0_g1~~TRINITY_DN1125_c0_g1_i1.p1  ORF type:complete len:399 (-),score=118.17 TRINITY_DN1125_c0_g1_i1:188-1384(-)